ncbi:MAG: YiiX/YebB-like N1pC/P60 family cysteine hydrolase [Chromatiales bacterium]|nr:YiiX/YebB-like N1pC/P60 family cysteine hydrolase [Chromatiales bacterium]
MRLLGWVQSRITRWLAEEKLPAESVLCNFDQLQYEIRPCDVLLVEGVSRISEVIKTITHSSWSHSALYIGRLHDIADGELRDHVYRHYQGDPHEPLVIEALLGEGTIITPLSKYRGYHLRICRPKGLVPQDSQAVIRHALSHLGIDYDVRQLLDMARFLFPYHLIPRRWRSTLFQHNAGKPTATVCSSMIADAFTRVHYPILPVVRREGEGKLRFFKRNHRLFTPSDFDYSPYFEIIKYPVMGLDDLAVYRHLPWKDGLVCNDENDCYIQGDAAPRPLPGVIEGVAINLGLNGVEPQKQGGKP